MPSKDSYGEGKCDLATVGILHVLIGSQSPEKRVKGSTFCYKYREQSR